MTYNTSAATVERQRPILELLHKKRGTNTMWRTNDAQVKSRRIREALEACKHHPKYAEWHDLKEHYRIRALGDSRIEAVWVDKKGTKSLGAKLKHEMAETSLSTVEVPEAYGLMSVIGYAIKFGPLHSEIHFPNAHLTDEEMLKFYTWCHQTDWQLISDGEGSATVTRNSVDPILLWEPPT